MEELYTLNELAEKLKLNPQTVRKLYRQGKIPGIKIGYRTLRFNFNEVLQALKKNNANQN